ncbi:WxL protein peptidoglycan domain-containing protein [Streptomyces acidicola]|uniref:WxL protein peptidoglycan domain-containing protein n=1 Tax=Streptomyces acidicola TaxID=2596892 RepID=UPI00382E9DF4
MHHPPRPRTTTAVTGVGALTRAARAARAAFVVLLGAFAALGVLGVLGAAAGPAAAADGDVSWTVATASNDLGSGRQNYSYTLDPGARLTDGLVVANHGTTPLHLAVYTADGFTTDAGKLDLVRKDARSRRVGAWAHADRSDVTVRPGRSAEVPFTLAVPDDAEPGDYMGGIVTSLTRPGQAEQRLGIRIRLRVGGELRPNLSVEDLRVGYAGTADPFGKGEATVTYTIRNTGNAILAARQAVSLSGPFGRPHADAGKIDDSPQLLPGDTWKVSVPVRDVAPALRTTGTVTLTPLLTDTSGSIAPLAATETTTHTWTVPWVLLLVLLVVLCGVVVAIRWAFRRRRGRPRVDAA